MSRSGAKIGKTAKAKTKSRTVPTKKSEKTSAKKPPVKQPGADWRFRLVSVVLAGLLLVLTGRVMSLQVLDSPQGREFLQSQGAKRAVRTAQLPAYRGVITDRRGEPLAVSTPVVSLWANPGELLSAGQLPALAKALGVKTAELESRVDTYRNKQFMYLKRHLEPPAARAILEQGFKGVSAEREYRRFYPAGEVAAQVVGFTHVEGHGIEGVEFAYEDWLQGVPGKKQYLKNLRGEMVRDIGVIEPARPGKNLALSIDLRLQTLQHRELQRAVKRLGAKSGSVVTLDSQTGEILAMTNYPVFNPNNRSEIEHAGVRNRALTDVYEPGSTVKALTLVAAMESGRYTPNTVIDTSPGTIRVGRKVYLDPSDYGEMTLTGVLQKSSQVGITKLAMDLGHEHIWDVFNRFGIGEPPGTGFPGERAGKLPHRERWHITEQISLAFGYGITASALQLASAYSVFANGGVRLPVSMLSLEGEVPHGEQVISARTAAQMLDMLHAVTDEAGTAGKARLDGYNVGGKTGTVHKVGGGQYIDDKYVALFAGIAPIERPRIVTVVVIDEPKGDAYGGGSAAAPVFAAVTEGALRLLNVTPTRRGQPELLARVDNAGSAP